MKYFSLTDYSICIQCCSAYYEHVVNETRQDSPIFLEEGKVSSKPNQLKLEYFKTANRLRPFSLMSENALRILIICMYMYLHM